MRTFFVNYIYIDLKLIPIFIIIIIILILIIIYKSIFPIFFFLLNNKNVNFE